MKKKRDITPILMVGVFIIAAVSVGFYFPMQKSTCLRAVASGRDMGYDAAFATADYGPSIIPRVLRIVESGSAGRMAAAATLALIAKQNGSQEVISAIKARLAQNLSADYRAAYASALGQIRTSASEEAAAALVEDTSEVVRVAAVRGLARAKTDVGAKALGTALADSDDLIRRTAKDAIAEMARNSPEMAALAIAAAAAREESYAHVAAGELAVPIARKLQPAQLLPLLSSESAEARSIGLKAVGSSLVATGCKDETAIAKVIDLMDVHDQPPDVKLAALELAAMCRIAQAGPASLKILEDDPDAQLRAKAAIAVGRTQPEGAYKALLRAFLQDDASKEMKVSCLLAFLNLQKLPEEDSLGLARVLAPYLDGEDKTLAGMSILALEATSGLSDINYGPEQWMTWLARREFELRIIVRVRDSFESIKKAHAAEPDAEKTVKAVNAVGDIVQKVRDKAHETDQPAIDEFIGEMVNYVREVKKDAK